MTTKICTNCGNIKLILLRTHKLKACPDCNKYIEWELSKNQPPVGYNEESTCKE